MRSRSEEVIPEIIGKVVSGIVFTNNRKGNPRSQVFITFHDGTSFEFWADNEEIITAAGLDHQNVNQIVDIQERRQGTYVRAFRPSYQDCNAAQRDLLTE